MFLNKKNISQNQLLNFLFCLIPVSLIIGSLVVNLNILLLIIVSFFYIKKNKYNFTFDYTNILLTIFFLFVIFTTFLNVEQNNYGSTIKSILLIRFLLLYFVIELLIKNNKLNLVNFFIISLVCTVFVSVDVIIQYVFGKDIFGYTRWDGMIGGPFEHEAIAGTYIQKFSLFSVFGCMFLFKNKNLNKKILFLVILLLLIGAFLASNRMSTIILIGSFVLLFLFYKKTRLPIFASFMAFILIASLVINFDSVVKKKYQHLYKRFVVEKNTNNESEILNSEKNVKKEVVDLTSSYHYRIYMTVLESWKHSPIIGHGHKSFRTKCQIIANKENKYSCSTHPHNYHLQVLHDFGILGFLLISAFIFLIFLKAFKKLRQKTFRDSNFKLFFFPIIIALMFEVWPIKSTGDLFTSWNGAIVWLIVALSTIANSNFFDKTFNQPLKEKKKLISLFSLIGLGSLIFKKMYIHLELLLFYS